MTNEKRAFENHHKMLFDFRNQYYEYCVGGKTGYTDDALSTLVTFATKDDTNLVAVVLRAHGSGNTYVDTRAMLDYAFENFTKVSVTLDTVEAIGLKTVEKNAYVMLPAGITFDSLESKVENPTDLGDKTGKVTYTYAGQVVGEFEMEITDEYYNKLHGIVEKETEDKEPKKKTSVFFVILKVLLVVVIVIVILFLVLLGYATYRRAQKQKRRKARRMKHKREMEFQRYLEKMKNKEE